MNRILAIFADPANTAELLLLCVCLALIVLCALAWLRGALAGRNRYRIPRAVDRRRCERAGSQDEFVRRIRARGGL